MTSLSTGFVVEGLPSPTQAVWFLGPIPVRAYALCILVGIILAVKIAEYRWRQRGGRPGSIIDVTGYAVPAGIIGARLYHVATSWEVYFGADGRPWDALKIWQGGLGIWGAIAGGALGAYVACRRMGLSYSKFADAVAPGIAVGQAVGRLGNWFNNELYGGPTALPWGLRVYEWDSSTGQAVRVGGEPQVVAGLRHPTFAYEALWCLLIALIIVLLDRQFRLEGGRIFALYVMLYTLGRFGIERLRVDPAPEILGYRLNEWTAGVVFALAALGFARLTAKNRALVQHMDVSSKN